MADFATFRINPERNAAELVLRGAPEDDATNPRIRAFLGVHPENHNCGLLRLYTDEYRFHVISMFTTPERNARLLLKGPARASATDLFNAVHLGSHTTSNGSTYGWLRLKSNFSGPTTGRPIVTIGAEETNQRGVIVLEDAAGPGAGSASLGIDDDGPYLHMTDGVDDLELRPTGFSASSAKSNWNFVANDPTDPARQIYYNVLEGPEVGTYVRGRATLRSGHARVSLPEHFAHVTADEGLTVQLTARSAESEGVAAVAVSIRRLEIRELRGGQGNYDVDFVVQGVRRGHEGYEVHRPRRGRPSRPTPRWPSEEGEHMPEEQR